MAVVSEAVADVAEQVATEALEVADVARVFDGRAFGLGLVAGAVVAGGVTYYVVNRKLQTKYEQIAEEEISQMREHFRARLIAKEEKPDLGGLAEKVQDLGYVPVDYVSKDETPTAPVADPGAPNTTIDTSPETVNVFEQQKDKALEVKEPDEGWDYDTERSKRVAGKPYVIHRDEQEEMGLTQSTFTYYEGDDVLCDERDRVVDARDEILGTDFMEKFGHGSDDPNVVYIRNEDLGVEIEVCRSPNSYAEEVHGFKHSDENSFRPTRRVTFDDE
jgi:hypothetical protein